MRVTVVAPPLAPFNAWSRLLTRLLNGLGYRATLRVVPKDAYFPTVQDSRRRVQIGMGGWAPDYPAASNMLEILRCDAFHPAAPDLNNNLSAFCDRRADRLAQRASQLPAGDARADALWAAADKRITDQAATVPLLTANSLTFVSRRIQNFQYSQQGGVLYDQLWVR